MLYIGFAPGARAGKLQIHHTEGFDPMTYLEVVFNCGGLPGEAELKAVDAIR